MVLPERCAPQHVGLSCFNHQAHPMSTHPPVRARRAPPPHPPANSRMCVWRVLLPLMSVFIAVCLMSAFWCLLFTVTVFIVCNYRVCCPFLVSRCLLFIVTLFVVCSHAGRCLQLPCLLSAFRRPPPAATVPAAPNSRVCHLQLRCLHLPCYL